VFADFVEFAPSLIAPGTSREILISPCKSIEEFFLTYHRKNKKKNKKNYKKFTFWKKNQRNDHYKKSSQRNRVKKMKL